MQVYLSTLFTGLILAWLLRRDVVDGVVVFFFTMPFGMMAAVNLPAVGGMSILANDLVVVVLVIMFLLRKHLFRDLDPIFRPGTAGFALLLFTLYAVIATIYFPRIFAGATEVFSISRTPGVKGIHLEALAPGNGNLSQLQRWFLSVLAFAVAVLAMRRRRDWSFALRAVGAATVVHAVLGLLDIVTQATGTSDIMAPIRTANYALTLGQQMAGVNRLIGGFPEASSYGYISLALFGFWLSYWLDYKGRENWPLVMMLTTLFLVLRGTSSAVYVGFGALIAVFAVMRVVDAVRRADALHRRLAAVLTLGIGLIPLIMVGVYLVYALVPAFSDFIDRSLLTKLSSHSAAERGSWNRQAFINLFDTWFLGAGLGSVRASNWVAATLGTTGVIGFGLLVAFLWRVFHAPTAGLTSQERIVVSALKMGCAAAFLRALVVLATPNLDYIFFAMAGLIVGMTLTTETAPRETIRRGHALET